MKKRSILLLMIAVAVGYLVFDAFVLHHPACEIDPKSLSYYGHYGIKTAVPPPPILPVIDLTYSWPLQIGSNIFLELERKGFSWDSHLCFGKVALRTYFTDTWRADMCPICSSIRLLGPSVQLFVR